MLRHVAPPVLAALLAAGSLGGCSESPTTSGLPQLDSLHVSIQLPEGALPQHWYLEHRTTYVHDSRTGSDDLLVCRRTAPGVTGDRTEFRLPLPGHSRFELELWFLDAGERTVVMRRECQDGTIETLEPVLVDGVEYQIDLNHGAKKLRPLPRRAGRKLQVVMEEPGMSCPDRPTWTLRAFTWARPDVPVGDLRFREEFVYHLTRPVGVEEIVMEIPRLRYLQILQPVDSACRIVLDGEDVPVQHCFPGDTDCRNICTINVPE